MNLLGLEIDKAAPIEMAKLVLQGTEKGEEEIYPDPISQGSLGTAGTP